MYDDAFIEVDDLSFYLSTQLDDSKIDDEHQKGAQDVAHSCKIHLTNSLGHAISAEVAPPIAPEKIILSDPISFLQNSLPRIRSEFMTQKSFKNFEMFPEFIIVTIYRERKSIYRCR